MCKSHHLRYSYAEAERGMSLRVELTLFYFHPQLDDFFCTKYHPMIEILHILYKDCSVQKYFYRFQVGSFFQLNQSDSFALLKIFDNFSVVHVCTNLSYRCFDEVYEGPPDCEDSETQGSEAMKSPTEKVHTEGAGSNPTHKWTLNERESCLLDAYQVCDKILSSLKILTGWV